MSFHLYLIFSFLCLEVLIYLLFTIPLPTFLRRKLLKTLHESPLFQKIMQYHTFLILFILLFLLDSWNKLKRAREDHEELEHHSHSHIQEDFQDIKIHERIVFAERNLYLSAFTLFGTLVLNRWVSFLNKVTDVEENIEDLKKKLNEEVKGTPEYEKNK